MPVGLLPALGGGIRALAATGQASRLLNGYFTPYRRAFGDLIYFSYLPESLGEFASDPDLLAHVRMAAPPRPVWRGGRAASMVWTHAADFRSCSVLRIFQITGVIPALLANAWFGVPYVTTYGFWYGQLSSRGPKRVVKAALGRLGLQRAAAVIATTEELRQRAARIARRVELVPNGVDTAAFAPAPARRADGPIRRVLYVGRLSLEKNLSTLIRAAALLVGRLPLRLVFVGAGPLREPLEKEARNLGVDVELPGVIDQGRLPAVYGSADAFVLASFTEGHPKALLEAMSSGLPVVASDCVGNRSLVTDGVTGLLFDPYRPGALAAALERVLIDDALAAALGLAARGLVATRYDLAVLVDREIALLKSVQAAR
jgi:glycosyltransferase involved in cell wall biosynthesis